MNKIFEILCFISSASWVSSSITGISYLDPIVQKPLKPLPGENPCNPLYWYPRQIPEFCYNKIGEKPVKPKPTPEMPLPAPPPIVPMPPMTIPVPYPIPMPMPIFPSAVPQPQFLPPHPPQFIPPPPPQFFPPPIPQMPVPFGVSPLSPMMPMPERTPFTYPSSPYQAGLVPGVPGMVSQDGGINILPFSDAYSDMLEKHKQKMIRKRLQSVLDDYDDFPRKRRYRKYRRGYRL